MNHASATAFKNTISLAAKVILSGEHAVVHNTPAIACSINKYLHLDILYQPQQDFTLCLESSYFNIDSKFNLTEIKKNYSRFNKEIKPAPSPAELICYTVALLFDNREIKPSGNLTLHYRSEVAISRGLGSSALAIVATLKALQEIFKVKNIDIYQLGKKAEDLQHGKSSGLDIQMALQPGLLYFDNQTRNYLNLEPLDYFLVDSGKSASTTGQCVANSSAAFKDNPELLNKFNNCTLNTKQALSEKNIYLWQETIKQNNILLKQIGVVPQKVAAYIAQLEKNNFAAKICGAGSVSGDNAGIILVVANKASCLEVFNKINQDYGYKIYYTHKNREKNVIAS